MIKNIKDENITKEKPKRILHVIHGGCHGGIETVVFNYYQYIDKTKYQFDFIFHSKKRFDFHNYIEDMGGRIFYCPTLGSGIWKYFNTLKTIIKPEHTDREKLKVIYENESKEEFYYSAGVWNDNNLFYVIEVELTDTLKEVQLGDSTIPDSNRENNIYLVH